jgi:hypothetical protein
LAPLAAQTGAWAPPVRLSGGGQGFEAAAALDANGGAVALWDERTTQDQIWSRSKPAAGSWGRVTQVSPGALQTTSVFPAVRIGAGGFATAVWTDADGVWTADRPPDSKWNPAQLLIPGASSPIFVMNSQGDAAVVWTVGGPTASQSLVLAVLRPAGGAWTSQQTVATGVHITADHAGIGAGGAVVVTWESYQAFCNDVCMLSNYELHASRQDAGAGAWVGSGLLLGPDDNSHDARVALGSADRAMLVALSGSGAYVSATQGSSGGPWSSFNTVVDPQSITIVSDLASDMAGNVTMVYEAIGFSTSQALAVSGSIGGNTWLAPVALSAAKASVSQIYFAVAPSGAAVAVWVTIGENPQVRAAIRPTATGAWGSPATVSRPGTSEISPEAAAVNSSGHAIVIYSGYNAAQQHIEFAATYQ